MFNGAGLVHKRDYRHGWDIAGQTLVCNVLGMEITVYTFFLLFNMNVRLGRFTNFDIVLGASLAKRRR
jgi:hypothetical protein